MSTKLWRAFSQTVAWVSAGAVFAVSAVVSPVAMASDSKSKASWEDPKPPQDPDKPQIDPKDPKKPKEKDKNKKPGVVTKYGIEPDTKVVPMYGVQVDVVPLEDK